MKKIISKIGAAISSAALLISSVPTVTVNAEDEPKLLALAFDDGPNTTTTNAVLDVLEQYNAKATFFVIGTNINDETAKSVKRAYDMGMEIASAGQASLRSGTLYSRHILTAIKRYFLHRIFSPPLMNSE